MRRVSLSMRGIGPQEKDEQQDSPKGREAGCQEFPIEEDLRTRQRYDDRGKYPDSISEGLTTQDVGQRTGGRSEHHLSATRRQYRGIADEIDDGQQERVEERLPEEACIQTVPRSEGASQCVVGPGIQDWLK
jgi:hypothetical protein